MGEGPTPRAGSPETTQTQTHRGIAEHIGPEHLPPARRPARHTSRKAKNHQLAPASQKLHRQKRHAVGPGNGVRNDMPQGGGRPSTATAGAEQPTRPRRAPEAGRAPAQEEVGQAEPLNIWPPPRPPPHRRKSRRKTPCRRRISGHRTPLLPGRGITTSRGRRGAGGDLAPLGPPLPQNIQVGTVVPETVRSACARQRERPAGRSPVRPSPACHRWASTAKRETDMGA